MASYVPVPNDLVWIWEGFLALSAVRPVGWMAGAIPFAEILAYANLHGIEDGEMFCACVRKLDVIWLQKNAEREKDTARGHSKPDVPS